MVERCQRAMQNVTCVLFSLLPKDEGGYGCSFLGTPTIVEVRRMISRVDHHPRCDKVQYMCFPWVHVSRKSLQFLL